ncbi:hypothetical protein HA402_000507 [Bradysia odoriphaga]|nr:hypothetical protein HA402_000507 [Bradysia odoriphaga]
MSRREGGQDSTRNKPTATNVQSPTPSNGFSNGTDVVDQIAVPEMCVYCFEVLHAALNNLGVRFQPHFTNDAYPLFVTWKIGHSKRLRGCMGTFSPLQLHAGLRDFAIMSSFYDYRFSPITREDFPNLTVVVSILMGFEDAGRYLDWTVGVHGIGLIDEVGLTTLLPEVAIEQGWDQIQTIDALLRKGGFLGRITPEIRQYLQLIRYRTQKVEMGYSEYSGLLKSFQADHLPR